MRPIRSFEFHVERRRHDDRVFWDGVAENPQPPARQIPRWVPVVTTLALGAVALVVALAVG